MEPKRAIPSDKEAIVALMKKYEIVSLKFIIKTLKRPQCSITRALGELVSEGTVVKEAITDVSKLDNIKKMKMVDMHRTARVGWKIAVI